MPSSYTIGTHFEKFITEQISSGRYASASEVVREALRILEDRVSSNDEVRTAIRRGLAELDAGRGMPADEEFFEDIKKRGRKSLVARNSRKPLAP